MYNRTTVFITACLGLLLFGISLITLGSVAPDMKLKFQLDDLAAGGLFSILPIGILAGSVLFGPLTDRYGYKTMFIVSTILLAAGFEGIAFSDSLSELKIIIFIFGLAGGAINGVTNAVVADISAEGKGAALSMLGVSFGVGALLMPIVLASLKSAGITFENILAGAGILSLAFAIIFFSIKFPKARQAQGFPLAKAGALFKDTTLLLISFFLFFQSGLEAIINNWTTTYLTKVNSETLDNALYGLAFFVAGMTLMRLFTGSVFKKISPFRILFASLAIICAGCLVMKFSNSYSQSASGLFLLGVGLAGGFPIMLGFVGEIYKDIPGTAFSFALMIALIGNMLINYLMGIVASKYGVENLFTVSLVALGCMFILSIIISQKIKKGYARNTVAQ